MNRIVDTVAAQLATGVPPALMRKWLERGRLTHHGHDYHGRARVDLDEVQELAKRRRQRATCTNDRRLSHSPRTAVSESS